MPLHWVRFSKDEFEAELQLAIWGSGCADDAGGDRADSGIREIEVGAVEKIEGFGAEFEAAGFIDRQREIAVDGEVDVVGAGSDQDIAAGVAVGEGGGGGEGVDVEVARDGGIVEATIVEWQNPSNRRIQTRV
jgi:hypothetical protein